MDHPKGASSDRGDRVDFDRRVRLEFRGAQISSDGGLLVMRELDDALGLSDLASVALRDTRRGKNTVHRLDGLFRQSAYGRLAGYEDVNDADRLALDPVMRQVVGGRAVDAQAASASQMGRFETETLALPENREALADLNGQWIDRFHDRNGLKFIVLDMDSSVSPTHGEQEGSAWNGHFDCTCYHPNFLFNQFGMLERCALRNGNVHSADGWRDVLDPVIARYAERDILRFFRADAAYASPAIYARLEEAGYFYAIRLPANSVLREKIAHQLTRPVGRPSLTKVKRFHEDFEYQAQSWDKPRRVIAKIEWPPGELFPRVGFIVTNLPMDPDWVVRFYNQRGTAEQHLLAHASIRCQATHQGRQIRLPLDALVVQAVPRQRGAAAVARPSLQPGHLLALHRTARGHGRLVADLSPAQADQDRRPRRAPRPCHHLPTSRGCRHRPDGPCHTCRHPPIASAAVMRVTAKLAKTERKRQDNSVRRVAKRSRRVKLTRVRGLIRPTPGVSAPPDTARSAKRLICLPVQAILTLSGSLLGECRSEYILRPISASGV
jgi:hypothetical protein